MSISAVSGSPFSAIAAGARAELKAMTLSPGGGEGQGEGVDSNALRIVGRWEIPRTDC